MTNQIKTPALHKELSKYPETINSNYLVSELKVDKTKKATSTPSTNCLTKLQR